MAPKRMRGAPTVGTVQALRKAPRGSGARVMSHVPLFAGLSARDLRRVAALAEEVWMAPGSVVVEAGTPGDAFYVILDGTVRVLRAGTGRTVRRLGPGDHFGELALLDGGPRTTTVVADTSLDAIQIRGKAFRRMLLAQPRVGLKIMAQLAGRIRECERQITS